LLFALHWFFLLLAMIYAVQSVWELFKVAMVKRDNESRVE
jgi:hypothetical protein